MLTKIDAFTTRPTLAQANALVERVNRAREEVVRIAMEAANANDLCSVVEDTLISAGFGDLCGPSKVTVSVPVTMSFTVHRSDVNEMGCEDTEEAAREMAIGFLSDHLPSSYYSGSQQWESGEVTIVKTERQEA